MDAIIKQGTHVCDGRRRHINLGFVPDVVYAWLGNGASGPVHWSRTGWCERAQFLAAHESEADALCGITDAGQLRLGASSTVNVAGQTLHWLAIADNGSGVFSSTGWIGNGSSLTPIVGDSAPAFVIVKRDSSRPPVMRATGMTRAVLMDGSATSTSAITALNSDGTLSIGSSVNVNELAGGTIGEGHDCLTWWPVSGVCELVTWVGDGASARTIPHSVTTPVGAIGMADTTGTPGFCKLASMGTDCAQVGGTALASALTSLTGGIQLGDATYNASGVSYYAIVLGQSLGTQAIDSVPADAAAKIIALRGNNGSYIDCGVSDTLSMVGAFALEWWGELRVFQANQQTGVNAAPTKVGYLMARSYGDEGRADSDGTANGAGTRLDGTWSWGIMAGYVNDLLTWANPQFQIVTTNYCNAFDAAGNENSTATKPWRTGIVIPRGLFHVLVTHNGTGRWRLYLNGKLRKQRNINMTGRSLSDDLGARVNNGAGAGHRTVFGARQGSSAIGNSERLGMLGASVYGSELTPAQAAQMYRRNFLRDASAADIAPTERWLADSASGSSMPAVVNAANNGTIVGGSVGLRDSLVNYREPSAAPSPAPAPPPPPPPPPASFSADFTLGSMPADTSFARSSVGSYTDGSGLLAVAAIDAARFTRNPSTLAVRGLLLESAATNSLANSRDLTGSNATIVQTQQGADGASNVAWLCTEDTTTNTHNMQTAAGAISYVSGTRYLVGRLIKPGTATRCQLTGPSGAFSTTRYVNYSLVGAGSVLAQGAGILFAGIELLANGYYWCWWIGLASASVSGVGPVIGFINSDTAGRLPSYLGTGLTLIVDHGQVVAGAVDSMIWPIPTSGAAASVAADDLVLTTPSGVSTVRITYSDGSYDDKAVSPGANHVVPNNKVVVSANSL